MTAGFTAEEFEPDAAENTASDGASSTTAKVDGASDSGSTGGNGNPNAGSASGGNAGNTTGGAGGNSTGGNNDWPALGAAAYHGLAGEVVTGLLYVDTASDDMHAALNTVGTPLNALADADLVPGDAALAGVNASLR